MVYLLACSNPTSMFAHSYSRVTTSAGEERAISVGEDFLRGLGRMVGAVGMGRLEGSGDEVLGGEVVVVRVLCSWNAYLL